MKIRLKFDGISVERSSRSTPSDSSLNPWPHESARGYPSLGNIRTNFRRSGAMYAPTRAPRRRRRAASAHFPAEFPSQARFCLSRIVVYAPTHQTGRETKGKNVRLSYTYREYTDASVIVFPLSSFLPPPFSFPPRGSAFIRQIDRRDENNLSVFRERLLMFYRIRPRLNIRRAATLGNVNRLKC